MPTFLIIGSDNRLLLIEDLAAIAELDPQDADGVRFFEATAWQSQVLRVETPIARDADLIAARAAVADFLILVIFEADGPMPIDRIELEATPERMELSAVYLAPTTPPLDPELRELLKIEVTELIRKKRPRWNPRFLERFMLRWNRSAGADLRQGRGAARRPGLAVRASGAPMDLPQRRPALRVSGPRAPALSGRLTVCPIRPCAALLADRLTDRETELFPSKHEAL